MLDFTIFVKANLLFGPAGPKNGLQQELWTLLWPPEFNETSGPSQDAGQVSDTAGYRLVQLANQTWSVRSIAESETFHPVVGPAAEAEALYVRQLKARERFLEQSAAGRPLVVWDVGLGAAANALTLLRFTGDVAGEMEIVSFDRTLEPLRFARAHEAELEYPIGRADVLDQLAANGEVRFTNGIASVRWRAIVADFPTFLDSPAMAELPRPNLVFYDPFSPRKNPLMWSYPLFEALARALAANEGPVLATYSRSSLLRVTLLLAGFFVGAGGATGEKEETTIAALRVEDLERPLGAQWLKRARESTSAEPMWAGEYKQLPLSPVSWERLQAHPQFRGKVES